MTKRELAENYFLSGHNCSQAVVLAFKDEIGMDEETILKVASSFGGGYARMRQICGTVSGMGIVLGMLYGGDFSVTLGAKAKHYALVQSAANRFKEKNGSIVCAELLGVKNQPVTSTPEARTPEYYKTRPCARLVGDAAEILEEIINHGRVPVRGL